MNSKKCSECKIEKELSDFNRSSKRKDGYQIWCRMCQKTKYSEYRKSNPNVINAKWKRYYYRNRKRMIDRTRKYEERIGKTEYVKRCKEYNKNSKFTRYGITEEIYNQMLAEQGQKCVICKKLFDKNKPNSIHIDHDHKTGLVRGILCVRCNLFLGMVEKYQSENIMENALTYLRKTKKITDKEPL